MKYDLFPQQGKCGLWFFGSDTYSEAVGDIFLQASVITYKTAQCHNPEDQNP